MGSRTRGESEGHDLGASNLHARLLQVLSARADVQTGLECKLLREGGVMPTPTPTPMPMPMPMPPRRVLREHAPRR